MPSVVGNLVVQNSNGSFNLGDFYNVSPKENTKAYNGSGASNVGFVVNTFNGVSATNTFNGVSATNTFDSDVADQDQIGTA
ncbi:MULTISPECIES: spore germination protein [Bacillus]|nr:MULTISPECIES: spore germination protein [Bacillus]MBF8115426.1 spore germination protein [Bacillus cereus]RSC62152.1 spore germination protein [Bacillus sp. (in: firmicutes)]HDX9537086.1 spore germination protein [Bacillus thuringiensis]HDX9664214.1 spore germination protein [Bacillus cereus]